jgi:NAD-dependent DNA ligase
MGLRLRPLGEACQGLTADLHALGGSNKWERSQLSIIKRIFSTYEPEHREAMVEAIQQRPRPRRPNSEQAGDFSIGRRMASNRSVATRNMDELIGMCRMVLADGAVDDSHARLLLDWIVKTYHAAHEWPGNILYGRLSAALADGHIDPDEESDLLATLGKIVGGPPADGGPNVSGAIPFDDPAPTIEYSTHCFALTGQFVFGPRKTVQAAIEEHGGAISSDVSGKCSYLIVGTYGSDEWLHSTYGRKIIRAVEFKGAGKPIAIVTERHWSDHLG